MTHNPAEYYVIHDNQHFSMEDYLCRLDLSAKTWLYWGERGSKVINKVVWLADKIYAIEVNTSNLIVGVEKKTSWFAVCDDSGIPHQTLSNLAKDSRTRFEYLYHCNVGYDISRKHYNASYIIVEFATFADALLFKLGELADFESSYPNIEIKDVRAEVQLEMPQRSSVTKVMTR